MRHLKFKIALFVGDGKHRREGPCVGTKGFKAPEVRSVNHFLFLSSFRLLGVGAGGW